MVQTHDDTISTTEEFDLGTFVNTATETTIANLATDSIFLGPDGIEDVLIEQPAEFPRVRGKMSSAC